MNSAQIGAEIGSASDLTFEIELGPNDEVLKCTFRAKT